MYSNDIKYNLALESLSSKLIEDQHYDRKMCDNSKQALLELSLFNNIKCLDSNNKHNNNKEKFIDTLIADYSLTCDLKLDKGLLTVIKDNSLEVYRNNPSCCPLSIWEALQHNMEYKYSVKTTIKS